MAGVFISYRRQDSAGWAGRLHDRLSDRLGDDQVFMDVATLRPGEDYTESITRTLDTCSAVLVLIGPGWFAAIDEDGERRLDDPNDLHRMEIALALQRGIDTVPLLVDGASIPSADDLGEELAPLGRRHAVEITASGFHRQVDDLVDQLELEEPGATDADLGRPSAKTSPDDTVDRRPLWRRPAVVGVTALILIVAAVLAVVATGGVESSSGAVPEPGASFQYQLSGLPLDESVDAEVFDIDVFETPASTVESLQADDRIVMCYLNAGSFEDVRPDADRFPDEVLGAPVEGFPEELWLDITRLDILMPIMEDRLDLCVDKGFDGVEFDNVDAFTNDPGFELTVDDERAYLEALAQAAHDRGLSAGLKNALDLIPDIVDQFDWSLVEQCFEFEECDRTQPFVDAEKAVFVVEYDGDRAHVCDRAPEGLTVVFKDVDLGPDLETCT